MMHFPTCLSHCNDADGQLPAMLHFPSCRTCLSPFDETPFDLDTYVVDSVLPIQYVSRSAHGTAEYGYPSIVTRTGTDSCDAPTATCTESEFCDARVSLVVADDDLLVKPQVTNMVDTFRISDGFNQPLDIVDTSSVMDNRANSCVPIRAIDGDKLFNRHVGLPTAGCGVTDLAGSIETSEVSCVAGVRALTDFFCWAQPLVCDIGTSAVHWASSIAFSGDFFPIVL